jgi:hypothetical protein
MQMAKCKVFFLVILLLAYVSQGYAAAHMTCQQMSMKTDAAPHSIDMASDSGHAHHQSMDTSTESNEPNCCPDCDCLAGVCSSAALPVSLQVVSRLQSSATIDDTTTPTPTKIVFSLYRPPITR